MNTRNGVNIALKVIGSTGLDGIVLVAPNAKDGLAYLLKNTEAKNVELQRILTELRRQRLVDIIQDESKVKFVLSLAGAYRLEKLIVEDLFIPLPKKWDGIWRVVTFDVPIERSRHRAAFTSHLARLGFFMLQKSLWVYPYPCFAQVEQLAGHYNILRYCVLAEISEFDKLSTRKLLQQFNL